MADVTMAWLCGGTLFGFRDGVDVATFAIAATVWSITMFAD
jgi:hypothetical protein